jgi:uncharacterized delta-60 repeat protein
MAVSLVLANGPNLLAQPVYAADGDLDPTFGSGGKVTTDFNGKRDGAYALAIQSDGKLVAAGYEYNADATSIDFALARYNANGTLDGSFGSGGKVTTDFNGNTDWAQALAIQSDGKIVAAGWLYNAAGTTDFALARYNANGTLDGSFGSGGKVTTDFNGGNDTANALAIQSDGKIVVAGSGSTGAAERPDFALARYNANGTLDGSFGSGGKVTTDFNGRIDGAFALAIQSDGKLVAAGFADNAAGTSSDSALARYNANGTLDGSFGSGGKVTTDFNGKDDSANALGIQSDSKIVAGGSASNAAGTFTVFALARYNANGTLDASFGSGGKVTTAFTGHFDVALALAIQSDSKLVAAGLAANAEVTTDFALARYNANGTLDGSFGSSGKVTTDFNGNVDESHALAIQSDGRIVAAGSAYNADGTTNDFALARYQSTVGIQDLTSSPGPAANHIVLSWTAPDTGGGTPASAYDLRYSNVPINDSTWLTATQASGEPNPAAPGITETLTLPGFASGTRWYFALKFQDFIGNWSALSNVPSLIDIGFRPQTNGYAFINYRDTLGTDLTFDDLIKLFNSQYDVCYNPIGPCFPRTTASVWLTDAFTLMTGGHCEGMSVSSLRFFKGIDDPASFQSGATDAHDLTKLNARRDIAYYFVPQIEDPVNAYKSQQVQKTPSANLAELQAALSGTASDPMNLIIRFAGSGHAITPYAVEERADHWEVWVYNSNTPEIASTALITTTSESWSYNMGGLGIWSGNAGTQTFGVIPISQSALPLVCPWCPPWPLQNAQPQSAGTGQVWLTGAGHLLITDSQGHRLGYAGPQFVNEIPEATDNPIDGGLGIALEPIYTLPLSQTYSILLDGQTLTQTQTASLMQFGPGYATGADDIPLDQTTQDHVVIAGDGSQVVYQPSNSKAVTLRLATDSLNQGYQFQFAGADLTASQPVTATVDTAGGQLVYNNRKAGNGAYDLGLVRANASGQQTFSHAGLSVLATDIHYLQYAAWNGTGALTLLIDHGGDGTIDETVLLSNQASRLYLPLIMR